MNTKSKQHKTAGASQNCANIEEGATLGALLEKHKPQAQHSPLPTWTEQAINAIRQGQTENEFILHCHPDNRREARKAFRRAIVASVNQAQALAEALKRVTEWIDAGCDPSRQSLDKARKALANWEGSK